VWYDIGMAYYRRRDPLLGLAVIVVLAIIKLTPILIEFIAKHIVFTIFFIIICFLFGIWLKDFTDRHSIVSARKMFVKGPNTLGNEFCTVKYFQNDKIIVIDNKPDRFGKKKMFTLSHQPGVNLNKGWRDICRLFDNYSTVDYMAQVLDFNKSEIVVLETKQVPKPTPEQKQINIDNSNIGPKYVEMGSITPDPYSNGCGTPNTASGDFVNIDNIQNVKPTKQRNQDSVEFVNMEDINKVNMVSKIDINSADAQELSKLPGINIVMSKRIIEHRNLNGGFKSIDEFIAVSGVKEHFISKIKPLITLNEQSSNDVAEDNYNEGRIIDF